MRIALLNCDRSKKVDEVYFVSSYVLTDKKKELGEILTSRNKLHSFALHHISSYTCSFVLIPVLVLVLVLVFLQMAM